MAMGVAVAARADAEHAENGTTISIVSDAKGTDSAYYDDLKLPTGMVFIPKVHVVTDGLTEALADPYLDITLTSPYGITDEKGIYGGLVQYSAVTDGIKDRIKSVTLLDKDTANHTWTVRIAFSRLDSTDDMTIPVRFQYRDETYYQAATTVSATLHRADGTVVNETKDPTEYKVTYYNSE